MRLSSLIFGLAWVGTACGSPQRVSPENTHATPMAEAGAPAPSHPPIAIKIGDVVETQVTAVTEYGAFLKVGDAEGLLHVMEISWGRIEWPSPKIMKVGDKVRVKVTGWRASTGTWSFSIKALVPDPWLSIETSFPVGRRVTGEIYDFSARELENDPELNARFGRPARPTGDAVLMELAPGVDAVLPASELPKELRVPGRLKGDDKLEVVVKRVDRERRQVWVTWPR